MEGELDLWMIKSGSLLLKSNKPPPNTMCFLVGCRKLATYACSALCWSVPFTMACDEHQYNGVWIRPLLNMTAHAHLVIESRFLTNKGKDDGKAAFQIGRALAPVQNDVFPTFTKYTHVKGAQDMVRYYNAVNDVARSSVLFVVAHLPLWIKDLRVLIGKLLWTKYRLAWVDRVDAPDVTTWR